jgi:hypothetical protein
VFTGSSPGGATVSFNSTSALCAGYTNCTSGSAIFAPAGGGPQLGNFTMWITGSNPTISTTLGPSGYQMSGQVNFMFSTTSGTLQGILSFSTLGGAGTSAPSFVGTFQTGTGANGPTGVMQNYWGSGTTINNATFVLNTNSNNTVESVINGTNASTNGTPWSGDVPAPATPPPVPEPASIALLGSGLLALGGTIKRRYFK